MENQNRLERWATWLEITAQPAVWTKAHGALADNRSSLRHWIAQLPVDEIWFCGAGTSSYIGETAVAALPSNGKHRFRAVASTDLVGNPRHFLNGTVRPLVVSFGRSGDSTESRGTLDLLDRLAPATPRLNITCNAESMLATRKMAGNGEQRTILLPPESNDAGFAMTSSFTTMLMTAIAVFSDIDEQVFATNVRAAATAARPTIDAAYAMVKNRPVPTRAVFVGTGVGQALAREAALKILELTAGAVPVLSDSSLGFRHGPKSFMTTDTHVFQFASRQTPACLYDRDLTTELRAQYGLDAVTVIGGLDGDLPIPDIGVLQPLLDILPAQVAAVLWADKLGIPVDNPFAATGHLTRVVSHVKLYTDEG